MHTMLGPWPCCPASGAQGGGLQSAGCVQPQRTSLAACACAGAVTDRGVHAGAETMFADVRALQQLWVAPPPNTINTWAEPQNALGVTPNRVANSNEMVGNNSCYPAWEGTCPLPLAETKAEALA